MPACRTINHRQGHIYETVRILIADMDMDMHLQMSITINVGIIEEG